MNLIHVLHTYFFQFINYANFQSELFYNEYINHRIEEKFMNRLKYFIYQLIFFCTILIINVIFDKYVSKPFTQIDLIAICIVFPILLIIFIVVPKIYDSNAIRLRNKFLISILAFIMAIVFIDLLELLFF